MTPTLAVVIVFGLALLVVSSRIVALVGRFERWPESVEPRRNLR